MFWGIRYRSQSIPLFDGWLDNQPGMPLDWKQIVTWGIAFACGGMGGSLFTRLYVNRETWAEYRVSGQSSWCVVVQTFV
jgi:hypothetical protein